MNPIKWALDSGLSRLRFDGRTIGGIKFDLRRALTRWRTHRRRVTPQETKLQLGAGSRVVAGWLNSDIVGSQFDLDLAGCPLPFPDAHFTDIVSQHTIEHLDYDPQVIALFKECFRILKPGGRVWFTCPDLEKVCRAYVEDRGRSLDAGLKRHWPHGDAPGFPVQHRINYYFHQGGEHRNLMDFEMLHWALAHAGFTAIERKQEQDLLTCHRGFPARNDDFEAIYVTAVKPG